MVRYYKSLICPRCLSTNRLIDQLRSARPEVEIEIIEVLTHPHRVLRDRILTIPTLIVGKRRWYHAPKLAELLEEVDAG